MRILLFKLTLVASLALICGVPGIAQQTSYKQPELVEALRRGDAQQIASPDPKTWIGAVHDNSIVGSFPAAASEDQQETVARLFFRAAYVMAFAERYAGTCPLARTMPMAEIKSNLDRMRDWAARGPTARTIDRFADLAPEQIGQLRLSRFILDGTDDAATFQRLVPCDSVVASLASRALVDLLSSADTPPAVRPAPVGLNTGMLQGGRYFAHRQLTYYVATGKEGEGVMYVPGPADEIPGVLIGWETDIVKALQASQADGKKLVVFFNMNSCPWCDALASEILRHAGLNAQAGQFRAVMASVEIDPPNLAYSLHQKIGLDVFPVISILSFEKDGTLNELKRYSGYFTGQDLAKRLSEFLGNTPQIDEAAFDRTWAGRPLKPDYCWKIDTFLLCMDRLSR